MTKKIRGTGAAIEQAVALVPTPWWQQAGVSAQSIVDCLGERANRIDEIVELAKWEELGRAIEGGQSL